MQFQLFLNWNNQIEGQAHKHTAADTASPQTHKQAGANAASPWYTFSEEINEGAKKYQAEKHSGCSGTDCLYKSYVLFWFGGS